MQTKNPQSSIENRKEAEKNKLCSVGCELHVPITLKFSVDEATAGLLFHGKSHLDWCKGVQLCP